MLVIRRDERYGEIVIALSKENKLEFPRYDFEVQRTTPCYCVSPRICSSSSRCIKSGWKKTEGIRVYRVVISRRILKTIGYAIFGLLV